MMTSPSVTTTGFPLLCLLVVAPCANAQDEMMFPGPDHYYEKGAIEERSPCPGINTLANHGYLPRDGMGANRDFMVMHMEDLYGIPGEISMAAFEGMKIRGFQTTLVDNTTETFNLFDLYENNDHDVSLVRHDRFFVGPTPQFNESLYNDLASLATTVPNVLSHDELAQHQFNRIVHSRINNPEFNADIVNFLVNDVMALYFALGNPMIGGIPLSFLDTFLSEEKFPEGYVPFYARGMNLTSTDNPMVEELTNLFVGNIMAALTVDLSNATTATTTTTNGIPAEEEGEDEDTVVVDKTADEAGESTTTATATDEEDSELTPATPQEDEESVVSAAQTQQFSLFLIVGACATAAASALYLN